jgi:DNA adenine methylase
MSKQRGTFGYPGSKTTIRRWIIKHIPEHHLYVEPFGGAASVLVGKGRSKVEVYNDINNDCVTFFEAVKKRGDELAEWIDNTPYSRELFEQWCAEYPEWPDDIVERAGRFAFIQHSSFGGKGIDSGTPHFALTKVDTRPDACGSKQWDRKPEDITWIKDRFKGVQIECDDYETIFERYDHKEAFFYCDPPYVDVGDDYYQTEDGGFNHERFVAALHDLDGKWLVSYDHKIPDGLTDYTIVDREKKSTISHDKTKKTESLIMNYDPSDTPMFRQESQEGLDAYQ